jgi:PAS domain S-box-containing protein
MRKSIFQTALFYAILAGGFFLFDLLMDHLLGGNSELTLPHVLSAIFAILVSFVLLNRVLQERKRTEDVLRRSQDELETRVRDRTTELQLSNNRLHAIIETLPAGMVIVDAGGKVILANSLARSILGNTLVGVTSAEQGDVRLLRLNGSPLPPEEVPLNRAIIYGDITSGLEALVQHPDGRQVPVLMASSPVRDETGKIINAVRIVMDISELKRMEQALRESEERYRTLFDNFPEPTTVYDRNGVLLVMNLISARNMGVNRETLLGKTIFDLFGEAAEGYLQRMRRVIDSGVTENQEDMVDLPSGKRYFSTFMQRVQILGGQSAIQIISYDVTERMNSVMALNTSEEKFSTVFHYSPDAIGIIKLSDGIILDINDAFCSLFHYSRSEAIGKTWSDLGLNPSTKEQKHIIQLFRERRNVSDNELTFVTRDGNPITILVSLSGITVGGDACVLIIAHDITERKRAQEALDRIQDELTLDIQKRTSLEERQRLARELHDSVSQALYGISLGAHTALTLFDTDREKVLEAINYVLTLTQAGLTEMRSLIFELRPESLEMEGLVVALTRQTDALRARYGIQIELNLCSEPDVPLNIKEVIYRIAQEALHNAVKHARPYRLNVSLTREKGTLALEVCDDGVGFNPNEVYPGHLGLHSMRERAAAAGGALEIISAPDCGAQIRVLIPI